MSALLTLYMVKELLLPHNAVQVIGLSSLRGLFEFRGPMSDIAFAAITYGCYAGLIYFTPIIGGWVADQLLGAKRTVMIGVLLMSAGQSGDVVLRKFHLRPVAADSRIGPPQGQHLCPSRDALTARRGLAAFARVHDFFDRNLYRSSDRPVGDRAGRCALWLARRVCRCGGADAGRAGRLCGRPAPFAR